MSTRDIIVTNEIVNRPPIKNTLYERDFTAWARQQAELLRAGRVAEADIEHIAEEIDDMGREQAHALESAIKQALVHLLKLAYSPAKDPRRHWAEEVAVQRDEIESRLRMNPGLHSRLDELYSSAWKSARKIAAVSLAPDAGSIDLPGECPFSLAELRDPDFLPK